MHPQSLDGAEQKMSALNGKHLGSGIYKVVSNVHWLNCEKRSGRTVQLRVPLKSANKWGYAVSP